MGTQTRTGSCHGDNCEFKVESLKRAAEQCPETSLAAPCCLPLRENPADSLTEALPLRERKYRGPARHFSHRGGSEESQGLQGLPSAQAALDYPFTSNFSPPLGGQRHSAPSGILRARWQVKRGTPPTGRVTPARYFIFIVPMPW